MLALVVLDPHITGALNLVAMKLSQLRRLFDSSVHELWSESEYMRQLTSSEPHGRKMQSSLLSMK